MNSLDAKLINFINFFDLSELLFLLWLLCLLWHHLLLCDYFGHLTNLQHNFLNFSVHLYPLILKKKWAHFLVFIVIERLKENFSVHLYPFIVMKKWAHFLVFIVMKIIEDKFSVHLFPLLLITKWAHFLIFIVIKRLEDKDIIINDFPVRDGRRYDSLLDLCYWHFNQYWRTSVIDFLCFLDE
jgi:hypothetical protein